MSEKTDFKALKGEIASLRKQLAEINSDKEKWFRQKEDLKKEMAVLIDKVKNIKKEGNASASEIKKLKKERDSYNAEVKNLIEKVKEVHKERKNILEKHGIKESPDNIKAGDGA